jgi:hypothetical protein
MRPDGWIDLPPWLSGPAYAVLADLQGADPVSGVSLCAKRQDCFDGVVLGLFESGTGGGRSVGRSLEPAELLVAIADVLQGELAETAGGWGQCRPACPYHSHPAWPGMSAGEAWWKCPELHEPLYRIGARDLTPR